ncbi:hypothetical protein SEPCBS57363_001509 [Sporothrix epigloea]|uniref:Basic proline-rich protein n=1 Tax=Sporothrix epigloea TaxID=1892477 RepID=A0ABP0DAP5_9PEZI
MEPVPETERMEEFRSTPIPSMRLQSSSSSFALASPMLHSPGSFSDHDRILQKPPNLRRCTEPSSPSSPSWAITPSILPYRPRTASPLSGSHMRSRSTTSVNSLHAPSMGRTRSMPGVNGAGHLQFIDPRSSSPNLTSGYGGGRRSPALTARIPKKSLVEDVFPSSPTRVSVFHDSDRPLHERSSPPQLGIQSGSSINTSEPFARTYRPSSPYSRPSSSGNGLSLSPCTASAPSLSTGTSSSSIASITSINSTTSSASSTSINVPLTTHFAACPSTVCGVPPASVTITPPTSAASSPLHRPTDTLLLLPAPSYSSLGGLSTTSASVPSTPTSTRSRSPSISSLETIPDSPDAEEAALEAERMAQLKADADAVDNNADGRSGRSSLDAPTRGRTLTFGSREKRKRWSVCGAERRGDLDLETIWEV